MTQSFDHDAGRPGDSTARETAAVSHVGDLIEVFQPRTDVLVVHLNPEALVSRPTEVAAVLRDDLTAVPCTQPGSFNVVVDLKNLDQLNHDLEGALMKMAVSLRQSGGQLLLAIHNQSHFDSLYSKLGPSGFAVIAQARDGNDPVAVLLHEQFSIDREGEAPEAAAVLTELDERYQARQPKVEASLVPTHPGVVRGPKTVRWLGNMTTIDADDFRPIRPTKAEQLVRMVPGFGHTQVEITAQRVEDESVHMLLEALQEIPPEQGHILLGCRRVTLLSEAAIAALGRYSSGLDQASTAEGGGRGEVELRLYDLDPLVLESLQIKRFLDRLRIYPCYDDAVNDRGRITALEPG